MSENSSNTNSLLLFNQNDGKKRGVLDESNLPIIGNETFNTLLVTRTHMFSETTKNIIDRLNEYSRKKRLSGVLKSISTIILVVGLILVALFLVLKILARQGSIEGVGISLLLLGFSLSLIGILFLWFEYQQYSENKPYIPEKDALSEKEVKKIVHEGFGVMSFKRGMVGNYVSAEVWEILMNSVNNNTWQTLITFRELLQDEEVKPILRRLELPQEIGQYSEVGVNSESMPSYPGAALRSILIYALQEAYLTESRKVELSHLLSAYFKTFPVLKELLKTKGITFDLFREVVSFYVTKELKKKAESIFDDDFEYKPTGGIGKYWVYGYTYILDQYSTDLNEEMSVVKDKFGIGHEDEITDMSSILGRRSQKNILLIGEVGVGKSSLMKGFAQRILGGRVPDQLRDKRIVQLDITSLIAESSQETNLEQVIKKSMDELSKAGNTILYIDEIQEIIPIKNEESGTSLAGIMLPYLLEGSFPVIGTINYADYKKYFYKNESLRNSFQKVEVSELSEGETLQILKTLIGTLEKTYKLYLSFPAIYAVINLSKRYITERRLPDSAVRTIESACSWAQNQGLGMLTADKVAEFISMQTNIPVDNISSKEAQELGSLEDRVKQKVIGQDEAVEKVVQTLKRARADIRDPDRPIGTFLFMGPTGVGKTHLAKIVTQEYFSKENTNERGMISVDMSEYKELSSLNRFLGTSSAAGGLEQSTVTLLDKVRANPYGVILFDEIEKAHPQILDLFLQLFEEGRLTSNRGETVDFRNMIIICTSNIGSQNLLQTLSSGATNWETAKEEALKDLKSEMKPELINRFDQVIVFSPHDKENLEKITVLLLNDLAKRMKEKGYSITWDEDVPMYIANTAYEPGFGARPLRRFIQDEVESLIANKIIDSQLNKGDSLRITKEWF